MTDAEKQRWKQYHERQMLGATQSDLIGRHQNEALRNTHHSGMQNIDMMRALKQQSAPLGFCEVCDEPIYEWTARRCNDHKLPTPSFRLL